MHLHSRTVRSRLQQLVPLVLLLVLAGCSGTPVDDHSTTDTVATPAPVPTDDLGGVELAPGVTEEGIVDAERLAAAHDAYLTDRSYTRLSGTSYRFENGTLLVRTTFNRSVDVGADRRLLRRDRTGRLDPDEHYAEWTNRTLVVERVARDDSVRYHRRPRSDRPFRHHGGAVAAFVAEQEPRVVGKRRANGTTEYVLVARGVDEPDLFEQIGANRTTRQRLVAVVTREGLVRSVQLTARGTLQGERLRTRNYFAVMQVGETRVARPPWLDEALNATRRSQTPTTG